MFAWLNKLYLDNKLLMPDSVYRGMTELHMDYFGKKVRIASNIFIKEEKIKIRFESKYTFSFIL